MFGLRGPNMKAGAVTLLLVAHIINTSSFTPEIPLTSFYNIIKSVISEYRSTCVNILSYTTNTQGVFMNFLSVSATEQSIKFVPLKNYILRC
jgi:hypothetical protein